MLSKLSGAAGTTAKDYNRFQKALCVFFLRLEVSNQTQFDCLALAASVSAKRGEAFSLLATLAGKEGEIMKPSSFENAIRLQFDCLARKVVGTTVRTITVSLAE